MRGQRMWHTLRLFLILSAVKRTRYYKTHNIFHSMGNNCLIMDRKVPLYAKLISLGNNVRIASDVHFTTHDIITHSMLNSCRGDVTLTQWGVLSILKRLDALLSVIMFSLVRGQGFFIMFG